MKGFISIFITFLMVVVIKGNNAPTTLQIFGFDTNYNNVAFATYTSINILNPANSMKTKQFIQTSKFMVDGVLSQNAYNQFLIIGPGIGGYTEANVYDADTNTLNKKYYMTNNFANAMGNVNYGYDSNANVAYAPANTIPQNVSIIIYNFNTYKMSKVEFTYPQPDYLPIGAYDPLNKIYYVYYGDIYGNENIVTFNTQTQNSQLNVIGYNSYMETSYINLFYYNNQILLVRQPVGGGFYRISSIDVATYKYNDIYTDYSANLQQTFMPFVFNSNGYILLLNQNSTKIAYVTQFDLNTFEVTSTNTPIPMSLFPANGFQITSS